MSIPKYATARNPALSTAGPAAAHVAATLGTPLMPWQTQVADVALERDPHRPNAWRYPVVIVTVPRQAGKTTLLRAVAVSRALSRPACRVFMTAQTGKDARERWKDTVQAVDLSVIGDVTTLRESAGSEGLRFANGSQISPFAPGPKNLHGYTPPLVMIDEAWSFTAAEGNDLMAAIQPAQITLPDRQLWIVSTQGDARSAFLNDLIDRGREAVNDPGSSLAYFEWSADETLAGADPYAPETLAFHPAIGHTQRIEDLAALADQTSPTNWWRSILNLRQITADATIDIDTYAGLGTATGAPPLIDAAGNITTTPPPDGTRIAYAAARDGSAASIAVGWPGEAGPATGLLITRPGTAWLIPVIKALAEILPASSIWADDAGATRSLTLELTNAGIPVKVTTAREWVTACETFITHYRHGTLAHLPSDAVTEALRLAVLRPMAGGRAFDERHSLGNIDALKATILAVFAVAGAPVLIPQIF